MSYRARPVRGFKTLKTAYATIKGFEVTRALRKGQAFAFNITNDIRGEARIAERAFELAASALAEVIRLVFENLAFAAALRAIGPDWPPRVPVAKDCNRSD